MPGGTKTTAAMPGGMVLVGGLSTSHPRVTARRHVPIIRILAWARRRGDLRLWGVSWIPNFPDSSPGLWRGAHGRWGSAVRGGGRPGGRRPERRAHPGRRAPIPFGPASRSGGVQHGLRGTPDVGLWLRGRTVIFPELRRGRRGILQPVPPSLGRRARSWPWSGCCDDSG